MRRSIKIIVISIIVLLGSCPASFSIVDVYIDPGHGGSDPGNVIPYYENFDEKDVNLAVALRFRDSVANFGYTYYISRTTDDTVSLTYRANEAMALEAQSLISIHHNSPKVFDSLTQHTLAIWSALPNVDNGPHAGEPRDTDSKLALKIGLKVNTFFNYGLAGDHPRESGAQFTVLSRTTMPAAISEASFVSNYEEATLFYNELSNPGYATPHTDAEATAIYLAFRSWCDGQGVGLVDYEYQGKSPSDSRIVNVTEDLFGIPTDYSVPYMGCWLLDEYVNLFAYDFSDGPYDYTFHHWEWRDFNPDTVIESYTYNPINFFVWPSWDDSTHYWAAYFTGGPFEVTIRYPDAVSDTAIQKNSLFTINWDAPDGARSTCSLYIDYSINGGGTWLPIAGPIPYDYTSSQKTTGTYDWLTPDISSDNCYVRIRARDNADNQDTTVSHQFRIGCLAPMTDFVASIDSGRVPLAVVFTDNSSRSPTSWSWNFGDGTTSTAQNPPTHTYDSVGAYTVSLTTTNACGGDTETKVNYIQVTCPPIIANFSANSVSGYAPLQVLFTDNSTPPFEGQDYFWDFGDGNTSDDPMVASNTYSCPGDYTVSMTVSDTCGTDDTTKYMYIHVTDSAGIADADCDGISDMCDNCPFAYNPDQSIDSCTCLSGDDSWARVSNCVDGFAASIAAVPSGSVFYLSTPYDEPGGYPSEPSLHYLSKGNSCGQSILKEEFSRQSTGSPYIDYDTSLAVMSSNSSNQIVVVDNTRINFRNELIITVMDTTGQTLLSHTNNTFGYRAYISIREFGGYYYLGGYFWQETPGLQRFSLSKLNSSLQEVWNRSPEFQGKITDISLDNSGNIIVVGTGPSLEENSLRAVKLDPTGNSVIWQQFYSTATGTNALYSIAKTTDNHFVVAGVKGDDIYYAKINSTNGVIIWDSTISGTALDEARSVIATDYGGFILAGSSYADGGDASDLRVIKIDASGNTQWDSTYASWNDDRGFCITRTNEKGYVVGGAVNFDSDSMTTLIKAIPPCCIGIRGNVDGSPDDVCDISDLLFMVDYQNGGAPPPCFAEADVDGNGQIDIADLLYLTDYSFGNPPGPAPVSCPQ